MVAHPFRVRAVLFDWDGTLLNSYESDARAYLAAFRALEIKWGLEDLERHYSPDWYRVYEAAGLPRPKWDFADRLWRQAYGKEKPRLLPGARQTLRKLHSTFQLAIVSSGSGDRVRKQIRDFRLERYFSACICCEDAQRRKPDPAPLEEALRQLALPAEECVYVGDAPEDIEMARRAGVAAVGVRGPFPTADRVLAAKPDLFLESVQELLPHLGTFEKGNQHQVKGLQGFRVTQSVRRTGRR